MPETRELFRQMVREAKAVAKAEGVDLGEDVVDEKNSVVAVRRRSLGVAAAERPPQTVGRPYPSVPG